MLAEYYPPAPSLRRWAHTRNVVVGVLFVGGAIAASVLAFSRGLTASILLLLGLVIAGLVALIVWRPVIGVYAAVLLNLVGDSQVAGDSLSAYTGYLHEDLNTIAKAGIAFNPLELLLMVTTAAFLLRALITERRLRGGALAPHVLIFGVFLLFGYIYGIATRGDAKIGLFEVRAPFTLVMLYFLVVNIITDRRQVERLFGVVEVALVVLVIWGILRYQVVFHGQSGGPDGAFGSVHEDAVFLAFFLVIGVTRLLMTRPRWGRTIVFFALLIPALIAMFEMQRRAAFLSLYMAAIVLAIALLFLRPRLFAVIMPITAVLILVYSAVYWNSSSVIAQPIRAWRSQSNSSVDQRDYFSNLYRDNEKLDVRVTILSAPLTGIGFGHPFFDIAPLPILSWWPFQFYTPHAEVLWIWLKVGAGGFIAFWVVICTALLRVGRYIRQVGMTDLSFICLMAAVYVVMLLGFAYVDVGLANERCEILLGTMLGIIGIASRLTGDERKLEPGYSRAGRDVAR